MPSSLAFRRESVERGQRAPVFDPEEEGAVEGGTGSELPIFDRGEGGAVAAVAAALLREAGDEGANSGGSAGGG